MKRTRRQEIASRTLRFISAAVADLVAVDGGLYEGLADPTTEEGERETLLVTDIVRRVANQLRERADRVAK